MLGFAIESQRILTGFHSIFKHPECLRKNFLKYKRIAENVKEFL